MSTQNINQALAILKTMRPKQWTKNGLVFAALVFDEKLFSPNYLWKTTVGFVLFCLISGAVYTINDIAAQHGLFVIEEDTPQDLATSLNDLYSHLKTHQKADLPLELAAFTWYRQKGQQPHKKLALTLTLKPADNLEKVIHLARRTIQNQEIPLADNHPSIGFASRPVAAKGCLAAVFPGSGNHYLGMGRDIGLQWPDIWRQMDHRADHLKIQFAAPVYVH